MYPTLRYSAISIEEMIENSNLCPPDSIVKPGEIDLTFLYVIFVFFAAY